MDSLISVILEKEFCKDADIEQACNVQKEYGGRIGSILLNMGIITENQLLDCLAICLRLPRWSELPEKPQLISISQVRSEFFLRNNLYPVNQEENEVWIATNDPFKMDALSLIERMASKRVKLLLGTEEELRDLRSALESELFMDEDEGRSADIDDEIDKLRELASEAPVIRLVNTLITKSIQSRASDIHFESFKSVMKARFRIDGVMRTVEHVPAGLKLAVITRLKLMSGMNIAENRLPQDGRISIRAAGKLVDIRASSVPTSFGESFVLRLLSKEDIKYSLESLGFLPDHLGIVRQLIARPNGIILTTGPTGSGKTTTLYSVLNELVTDTTKIVTVEDPVEYELEGVNQIQVRHEIGYTFANALRSILRQDPDIIMIGEIRDVETAEIAIRAALTGHLVLSTLHTNSALSSITRLLDMGIEFFLLKASIIGLMAQRLVRRMCPHCAKPAELAQDIIKLMPLPAGQSPDLLSRAAPRQPVGCERCNQTGYIGRIAIAELIPFTEDVQGEFEVNKNFDDPNKLGYRSIRQDGFLKVLDGQIAIEEVLRLT